MNLPPTVPEEDTVSHHRLSARFSPHPFNNSGGSGMGAPGSFPHSQSEQFHPQHNNAAIDVRSKPKHSFVDSAVYLILNTNSSLAFYITEGETLPEPFLNVTSASKNGVPVTAWSHHS
jgi:hypothetical protein